jgi:hypothetical protein
MVSMLTAMRQSKLVQPFHDEEPYGPRRTVVPEGAAVDP